MIKAACETMKAYCTRQCATCKLKLVCSHYFDYGNMYGFAESVLRVLKNG